MNGVSFLSLVYPLRGWGEAPSLGPASDSGWAWRPGAGVTCCNSTFLGAQFPGQCLILTGIFGVEAKGQPEWLISSAAPIRKTPRQQHLKRPQQESSTLRALAGGHGASPECSLLRSPGALASPERRPSVLPFAWWCH